MTGLRERKKQRTREAIVDAALELFAERGYEQTTIADIADAADVSARTVFSYFPSKEDILFSDLGQLQAQLAQMLADRAEGVTTLDVLRDFIYATLEHKLDEKAMRRKHVLACDEGLRNSQRGRLGAFEEMIVGKVHELVGKGR